MNPRHYSEYVRSGSRIFDGRESCGECEWLISKKDEVKIKKLRFECSKTGSVVDWPATGPVNMDCPLERMEEAD